MTIEIKFFSGDQPFVATCSRCGWTGTSCANSMIASFEGYDHDKICPKQAEFSPLEQFDAAIQTVTQQRGEVYGHPAVDFDRAHRLIAVVDECEDVLVRHALRAICIKLVRLIHSPSHLDSAIDVAGYARTIAMIWDKRAKDGAK